jgi:hypothetical protein
VNKFALRTVMRVRLVYIFWDRSGEYLSVYRPQQRSLMMASKYVVMQKPLSRSPK